jgi:16S rRNA (uracil1498-N3)-methyltransferase
MQLFYTPDISGEFYTLSEDESKHCVRVLRLVEGDAVQLVDGCGGLYVATITEANHKRCTVRVGEVQRGFGKRGYYLHLAVAPTKNTERYEWLLEKATEIGVDEITPLLCEHSERKLVKDERSLKVITAAVKQSLKAYHPQLNPMLDFAQLVSQNFGGTKLIAHCHNRPKILLKNAVRAGEPTLIAIGPEGDFSLAEVELAVSCGFTEVSLGESRLRTETAGVVACHTLALANQT